MVAIYHRADSENGDHIDDLNDSDNTFVVIQPDEVDPFGTSQ